MVGVAHDRGVAMDDDAVLYRLDRSRRQVDDDIALAEAKVERREPLCAFRQRLRAGLGGDVQRLQRRAGDDSSLLQTHARLKMLDR